MSRKVIPVSVVILTKNEASNVRDLISTLSSFNQVIVFDSNSTDSTIKYAKELGVTIENFTWNFQYPKKKQSALELEIIENDWILLLDADERISQSLADEIYFFVSNYASNFVAGQFSIDYYFAQQKLSFGYKPKKLSLFRKGKVFFPEVDDLTIPSAWEVEGHYQPFFDGDIYFFKNQLVHKDNDPIPDWFNRHIKYADWDSAIRIRNPRRDRLKNGLTKSIFAKIRFRGLIIFIYSYVIRLGFLDGRAGFDYAFALSWFYWLSDLISREKSIINKNAST